MKPKQQYRFLLAVTSRKPLALSAAALLTCLATPAAFAATLTWDTVSGDGAAITAGSGNWNLTAGNTVWNNGTSNVIWSQTANNDGSNAAAFAGTDGTLDQYVITLAAQMAAESITFNSSGYQITGSTLALMPTATTNGAITVAVGKTATINSAIAYANNAATTITANAGAVLNLGGGASNAQYTFTGAGTVNMTAGTYTANTGAVNVASFNQSGGTFNVTPGNNIGYNINSATQNVAYNIAAGTLSVNGNNTTATVNNAFLGIGNGTGANTSTLNVGGTSIVNVGTTASRSGEIRIGNTAASNGVLNVFGGTVTIGTGSAANQIYFFKAGADAGFTAAMTQSAGTVTANGIQFGGTTGTYNSASVATLQLSGGSLYIGAQGITKGSGASALPVTIQLQGGTLAASVNWSSSLDMKLGTSSTIQAANSTNVARDITLSGILSDDGANGTLTKTGTGTLTLSGSNSYTGATAVTGGILTLSGTGAVNSSSGISVNGSGAKLLQTSSVAVSPEVTLTQGTLTGSGTVNTVNAADSVNAIISNNNGVAGAALTIGNLTLAGAANINLFSNTTAASLIVTGTLTTAATPATITANNAGGWTNGSTYTLLTFGGGSIAGSANNFAHVVNNLVTRQSAVWGSTSSEITLAIAGDNPVWSGANGGAWTTDLTDSPTSATPNWALKTGLTATDFWLGDKAEFNDTVDLGAGPTAPTTTTVDISTANVSPTTTVFNNSTLDYTLNSGGGFGIANGNLIKNGSGNLTITAANTYSGTTEIHAGTITLSGSGSLGTGSALTLGGGKLDLGTLSRTVGAVSITAPAASGDTIGNGSLTGTSYAASNATGNAIISANLLVSGSAGFAKSGVGTVTLSGNNTYTGATAVNGGILKLSGTGKLGNGNYAGAISIAPTATLENASGTSQTLSGAITGGGTLLLSAAGGMVLSNSGNAYGALNITGAGRVFISASGALPAAATVSVSGGGILDFNTGASYAQAITVGDTGGLATRVTGGTTFSNVTLPGTGILILNNDDATTTNLTITNGQTLTGNLTVQLGGSRMLTTTAALGNVTLSGVITGSGGLTFASSGNTGNTNNLWGTGVLTLTGANDYTGGTTLNQGTLTVGTGGTLGATTGALAVNNTNTVTSARNAVLTLATAVDTTVGSLSGTIATPTSGTNTATINTQTGRNFTVNQTVDGTYAGVIAGGGSFTLGSLSTAKLALTGANTYSGATLINGGVLELNGSISGDATVAAGATLRGSGNVGGVVTVQSGGFLAPGNSIESLVTGSLNLNAGSTVAFELNNDADPSDAADLVGTGDLTLDVGNTANLTLTELGAGTWDLAEKITLFSYGGAWNGGLFNFGSAVADDSVISFGGTDWLFNYNDTTAGTNFIGDLTGTAYVTMTVVPEPGTVTLLGGMAVLALLRRRRA